MASGYREEKSGSRPCKTAFSDSGSLPEGCREFSYRHVDTILDLFQLSHFDDICPGYDTENLAILNNRDPAKITCRHDLQSINHGGCWRQGNRITGHDIPDLHCFPVYRTRTVYIRQGYHSDQCVPFNDGKTEMFAGVHHVDDLAYGKRLRH